MLNKLTAISPVDGRYRNTTETLADYFSEQALIRYRIRVEVEYFIALCEIPLPQLAGIDRTKFAALRALYLDFSPADAERAAREVLFFDGVPACSSAGATLAAAVQLMNAGKSRRPLCIFAGRRTYE